MLDCARLKQNGLETLWNITIECTNDKVKEESMDLLVDFHLRFGDNVTAESQKLIWEEFVEKCMEIIESGGDGDMQHHNS